MNTNGHELENAIDLFVGLRADSWTLFFFAALRLCVRLAFKSGGMPR
jgi:hypothetical protein